ncbi:DHS-like NAD/FAD-binding domain-containing protein [Parathielavia hyrcaniae]|uniref:DHS-like NAD/FAD-binding domain-containing protein n=1 Tax=Parathielavia hyrcaniae TaxID=113614 RepID=A0AAN6Q474_9PEZI|nr:DHS-like NAD/FAD-binding domain-containing protein [Parathielavia hyrcaniae]
MPRNPDYNSIPAFHAKLARSRRILAVCGAGLSASSGLPTFRGAGGLWRNYEATALASPKAFKKDPGLVWMFYAYRRHMALKAKPNAGHYALAELARNNPEFLCLSQNVDNLHIRANHPPSQLRLLHGSLFTLKCSSPTCSHTEPENLNSPLCPALAAAAVDAPPPSSASASAPTEIHHHPLLDTANPLPTIPPASLPPASLPPASLPHCPRCTPPCSARACDMLAGVDEWIRRGRVDVVLVVGTSSLVWPAAGIAEAARGDSKRGKTSVVPVNVDAESPEGLVRLVEGEEDFAFGGDAAEVLPRLLEPVIGRWDMERGVFLK